MRKEGDPAEDKDRRELVGLVPGSDDRKELSGGGADRQNGENGPVHPVRGHRRETPEENCSSQAEHGQDVALCQGAHAPHSSIPFAAQLSSLGSCLRHFRAGAHQTVSNCHSIYRHLCRFLNSQHRIGREKMRPIPTGPEPSQSGRALLRLALEFQLALFQLALFQLALFQLALFQLAELKVGVPTSADTALFRGTSWLA